MEGKYSVLLLLLGLISYVRGLRVNITMFDNCQDMALSYDKLHAAVTKVTYDRDDEGLCNTMHIEYRIANDNYGIEDELLLTTYKCPLGTDTVCLDNPQEYREILHCDRFHTDNTGPWYMFAIAMTNGDRCGQEKGTFNIDQSVLKLDYLHKYIEMGKGSYRLRMLFHEHNTEIVEKNIKTCIEMDFLVID
ncbi:uncharacterized protein LOC131427114 [Malaya genurostris]|uniref:uncharacterized protein LOC131427114 n=1 Tax=Malaya genurostris TaxID=325434 RepID=UPI0026F3F7AC|nr:uncharacterized protein LOC131427114 [Malaya genurostris]